MPKGDRGERRPADRVGAAVKVLRIATVEDREVLEAFRNAAVEVGSRGGKARAARLSKRKRAYVRTAGRRKMTAEKQARDYRRRYW